VQGDIVLQTQLLSLKTGLPMVSMTSSRSSLSQSWLNIQWGLEAYRPLEVLQYYPNRKPLLVIAMPNEVRANEQTLFRKCVPLPLATTGYQMYELPFDSLLTLHADLYEKTADSYNKQPLFDYLGWQCTTPAPNGLVYLSFDSLHQTRGLHSPGAIQMPAHQDNVLLDIPWQMGNDSAWLCSFWLRDMNRDRVNRIFITFYGIDSAGQPCNWQQLYLPNHLRAAENGWGLIEFPIAAIPNAQKLFISLRNDDLPRKTSFAVDELLLRPVGCDVYKKGKNYLNHNNRYYFNNASSQ
jgi:hypothetical protein